MNEERVIGEREKMKVGKEKSTQEKKKKHVVKVCSGTYEEMKELLAKCNDKNHGREISVTDIIKYGIKNFKESDLKKIQEESLTLKDKISIEHNRYLEKMKVELTLDEFVALKLKIQ